MSIDDEELDRRLAALTREAPSDASNWHRIERRIRPRRHWRLSAAAAGVALAAGLVVVLQLEPSATDGERVHAFTVAEIRAMRASAPTQLALEQVDSAEALMQAWAENRAAIDELEAALARDPGNALLLEFLREARLRQARLIQQGMKHPQRSMEL